MRNCSFSPGPSLELRYIFRREYYAALTFADWQANLFRAHNWTEKKVSETSSRPEHSYPIRSSSSFAVLDEWNRPRFYIVHDFFRLIISSFQPDNWSRHASGLAEKSAINLASQVSWCQFRGEKSEFYEALKFGKFTSLWHHCFSITWKSLRGQTASEWRKKVGIEIRKKFFAGQKLSSKVLPPQPAKHICFVKG